MYRKLDRPSPDIHNLDTTTLKRRLIAHFRGKTSPEVASALGEVLDIINVNRTRYGRPLATLDDVKRALDYDVKKDKPAKFITMPDGMTALVEELNDALSNYREIQLGSRPSIRSWGSKAMRPDRL